MPRTHKNITVKINAKFLAFAAKNGLSPELLASLWCNELARRNPTVLKIRTRCPLQELEDQLADQPTRRCPR